MNLKRLGALETRGREEVNPDTKIADRALGVRPRDPECAATGEGGGERQGDREEGRRSDGLKPSVPLHIYKEQIYLQTNQDKKHQESLVEKAIDTSTGSG